MRRVVLVLSVVLSVSVIAAAAGPAHGQLLPRPRYDGYVPPGTTQRVSVDAAGDQLAVASEGPSLSGDARLLAFVTSAALVADDANGVDDVYVRDLATGHLQRVSLAEDGSEAELGAGLARVSRDGRHVGFVTAAPLVADDTNDTMDVYVRTLTDGSLERVSVSDAGAQGSSAYVPPELTPDGRYVVFHSQAGDLVDGDTNGTWDVFVRDRVDGTTERVSIAADGIEPQRAFVHPAWTSSISDDGRYVAFGTYVPLVAGDTNNTSDVYLRDRVAQTTEHISVSSHGEQGGFSAAPAISGDGRYVAFWSMASNLVPEDTTGAYDIFVRDRLTGTTERISTASDGGTEGDSHAMEPVMTPDGRFVTYMTLARTVVENDSDELSVYDVHVHDLATGSTELVSVATDGRPNTVATLSLRQPYRYKPAISDDGRYIVFGSDGDLVPGDSNEQADVFLRDRGPAVGVGSVAAASTADSDGRTVTGGARFSGALLLAADDDPADVDGVWRDLGAELTAASVVYRPERRDLLVRLDLARIPAVHGRSSNLYLGRNGTGRVVSNYAVAPGVLYGLALDVDGVDYEIRAMRIAASAVPPQDPNLVTLGGYVNPRTSPDSYFGLFRCDPDCAEVARLAGGLGRRGHQVTAAVPVSLLDAGPGSVFGDGRAYTALGEVATGPVRPLDAVGLGSATLPATSAAIGSAAATTPPEQVVYDEVPLVDGRFTASLPDVGPDDQVWFRACLGDVCGYQSLRQ